MSKKKSRKKSSQGARTSKSAQPSSSTSKKKFGGMMPVYIIGGLLFAGVLTSGMITKFKRGEKERGEECTNSKECKEGVCFPDAQGTSRCTPLCGKDRTCPIGYKCVSQVHPKRRSMGMLSICVEK
jgi:hypothetical protein